MLRSVLPNFTFSSKLNYVQQYCKEFIMKLSVITHSKMLIYYVIAMLIVRYGCGKGDLKGKTTTGNFISISSLFFFIITSK